MKQVWLRLGGVLACGAVLVLLDQVGWLGHLVQNPIGLAAYWILVLALSAVFFAAVVRPLLAHLKKQDTPLARFLTNRFFVSKR